MPPGRSVLIIGDSISMGYTPAVAALLADRAEVVHNPGNGGDSDNVAAHLQAWLKEVPGEVVHFNCGLHDVKCHPDPPRLQVPLERYRQNLSAIVQRLGRTGAALVWASSTPVVEDRHARRGCGFDRFNRDVEAYNAAAEGVVTGAGIHVNDLHAAVVAAGAETLIGADGVHMTEEGSQMLARAVAECVRRFL